MLGEKDIVVPIQKLKLENRKIKSRRAERQAGQQNVLLQRNESYTSSNDSVKRRARASGR